LRKYRLGDDNSLGVAYLSNAYVYGPHSDNNVIPECLACQGEIRVRAARRIARGGAKRVARLCLIQVA
jgi:hypothetical protein